MKISSAKKKLQPQPQPQPEQLTLTDKVNDTVKEGPEFEPIPVTDVYFEISLLLYDPYSKTEVSFAHGDLTQFVKAKNIDVGRVFDDMTADCLPREHRHALLLKIMGIVTKAETEAETEASRRSKKLRGGGKNS